MDKVAARRCACCGALKRAPAYTAGGRGNKRSRGCASLFEQHTAVFSPAHASDARCFQLESIELLLLLSDDSTLPANLVGELLVFDQQRAMRQHLHYRGLQLMVGPRLAHELEDAGVVDRPHDAFDIGIGADD